MNPMFYWIGSLIPNKSIFRKNFKICAPLVLIFHSCKLNYDINQIWDKAARIIQKEWYDFDLKKKIAFETFKAVKRILLKDIVEITECLYLL